eukprot:151317-Chlamydomonas_euryale.AAC.2
MPHVPTRTPPPPRRQRSRPPPALPWIPGQPARDPLPPAPCQPRARLRARPPQPPESGCQLRRRGGVCACQTCHPPRAKAPPGVPPGALQPPSPLSWRCAALQPPATYALLPTP